MLSISFPVAIRTSSLEKQLFSSSAHYETFFLFLASDLLDTFRCSRVWLICVCNGRSLPLSSYNNLLSVIPVFDLESVLSDINRDNPSSLSVSLCVEELFSSLHFEFMYVPNLKCHVF